MAEAIDESIVDSFTLKPILTDAEKLNSDQRMRRYSEKHSSIYGQIKGINKEFIFLEINDQHFAEYVRKNCDCRHFDIYFQLNLTTYQLQHNALEWMVNHHLFDSLVDNPHYNSIRLAIDTIDHPTVGIDYDFR